jgi:hypothetical protein
MNKNFKFCIMKNMKKCIFYNNSDKLLQLIQQYFQTEQDHIPPGDLECSACARGPDCQGEEGPDRVHEAKAKKREGN